jgi:hypothetical protein
MEVAGFMPRLYPTFGDTSSPIAAVTILLGTNDVVKLRNQSMKEYQGNLTTIVEYLAVSVAQQSDPRGCFIIFGITFE